MPNMSALACVLNRKLVRRRRCHRSSATRGRNEPQKNFNHERQSRSSREKFCCQDWFAGRSWLGWLSGARMLLAETGGTKTMSTLAVVEEILRETAVPLSVKEVVERAGSRLPS